MKPPFDPLCNPPESGRRAVERLRKQAAENLTKLRGAARETQSQVEAIDGRIRETLENQERAAWREALEELASVRGEPVPDNSDRTTTLVEIKRHRQLTPVREAYEQAVQRLAAAQRNLQYFQKLAGILAMQIQAAEQMLAQADELDAELRQSERAATAE